MKVLLIDDEPVALKALQKRVDWPQYGFGEVLTAQDAAEAREILGKHFVDMVLCDVEMPGENGLSLVKFIKERTPDTECVMVTCHAEFDYIRTALRCGVSDYILKPIDYSELNNRLTLFAQNRAAVREQLELTKIVDTALQEREPSQAIVSDRIEIVKQYIEEHLREKLYIEDLSGLVHINEQHLMRIFKKETGQSLTEYMAQRRILIAGKLLRTTDYSINFIADCVGCENFSYFTKIFKRYTGVTPSEYRKGN